MYTGTTIMLNELHKLVNDTHTRVLGQVLTSKKNKELFDWIMDETKMLENVTIKERVWYLLKGKPNIICLEGNKKTFNPKTLEYGFCDNISKCKCFREQLSQQRKGKDMAHVIEKRVQTWEKKYGVKNVALSPVIQEKRRSTIEKNSKMAEIYTNLAYNKETKGFNQIVDRVKDKVIPLFDRNDYNGSRINNKYKWECVVCQHQFIDYVDSGRTPVCKKCYPNQISSGEKEIKEYILSLGISNIQSNTKTILGNLEYDLYLPDFKIAIEYNGIYWHSDLFKDKTYHVTKFLRSKQEGIHLIQIFEDEWLNKKEIIKNRIKSILGVNTKIFARKCSIRIISNDEYKSFVLNHHLQGYAPCTYRYGLLFQGEIVAVMSFSKSRYTKTGYELIRYCSKHNVVGGASKLFKFFIQQLNPTMVVSYANRCWSKGNLYEKLGFSNITANDNNTGYWYIKNGIRYHRSNFNKKKLIKLGESPNLSEVEIMKSNGFLRIYDCGNYKFLWVNPEK